MPCSQETLKRTNRREIERELSRRSFAAFCQLAWHVLEPSTPLRWGWALDAMAAHLEAVHNGTIKNLLINVPPGCMKSLMTSVFFPAWEWGPGGRPDLRFISTSHAERLAIRDNLKCRRLVESEWYRERWPLSLEHDQNAKARFETVSSGFRECMAFTSMTGSRGDRVIIDDPLSVNAALSDAELETAKTTFLESVPTRVNDEKSSIIVIMQRLHQNDTSGIILERGLEFEHLMLPMRFDLSRRCKTKIFTDPRTEDGELLFPERFSEETVSGLERTMGAIAAAGQLQQSPVPRGGAVFQREWVKFYKRAQLPPQFEIIVQSWDMTFKAASNSDYVCGLIIARKGANYFVLARKYGRFNYVESKKQIIDLSFEYPKAHTKLIEDKANGSAIIDDLGRDISGIVAIKPTESKEARAQAVTPLFEAGNVFFPDSDEVPWVNEFLAELLQFPAGAHDDQVDALTQGLNFLLHKRTFKYSDRDKLLLRQGIR